MKNLKNNLFLFIGFLILAGILAFCIIFADDTIAQGKEYEAQPIRPKPQIVIIEKEVVVEPPNDTELSEEDFYLLVCVVHAEAGNQDMTGKRLVADVVLNRMYSEDFPDTIHGVVYQKNQFESVPQLGKQILEESDFEAVRKELKERLDTDIVFFQRYSFSPWGSDAYIHGAHYFSYSKNKES